MKQYRITLGIEIGRDFIRLAEVEHREGKFFLAHVSEDKIESLEVDGLVQKLSLLISSESIMARVASVAVDTSLMPRDTIDIDPALLSEEISGFLRAEIDLHSNFSGESYIPAYEITKAQVAPFKEVFYAGLEKKLLMTLREVCTRCGLDLQYVDLDHACSEVAVNKLQPGMNDYILVTVKEKQVEASYCRRGERLSYRYVVYSGEPFYFVTKLAQDLESITKGYAERIYITGRSADGFLIDLLRKSVDERYVLLEPTQGLTVSPAASEKEALGTHPHRYSHAIGAALK